MPIDASETGFFAEGFAALGPAFVLDLREGEEPGKTWLAGPRCHHSTGWLAPVGRVAVAPLAGRDAVLHLDETHGAVRALASDRT